MNPIQFKIRDSVMFQLIADDFSYDWYAAVRNNVMCLRSGKLSFIIDINTLAQIDSMSLKSIDQYLLQQTIQS